MFLIGCSFSYKQHFVDDCYTNTAFRYAAELLVVGGIFAEPRGEALSARDPDLRCLSTSGVGSEVDFDVREAVLLRDASCEILTVDFLQCPSATHRLPHKS